MRYHAVHRPQAGGYCFVRSEQQFFYFNQAEVGLFQRVDQTADLIGGRQDAAEEGPVGKSRVSLCQLVPGVRQVQEQSVCGLFIEALSDVAQFELHEFGQAELLQVLAG